MKAETNAEAMLTGGFLGDSHALGVHWIYNAKAIEKRVGRVDTLLGPVIKTFHPNRSKGEFTHYGDQMMHLMDFVKEHSEFRMEKYLSAWREMMAEYDGYRDHATKETLANLRNGAAARDAGSNSTDFAGAVVTLPLIYQYRLTPDVCKARVRERVLLTHNNPAVLDAAEYFTSLLLMLLKGEKLADALAAAAKEGRWESDLPELVQKGLEKTGGEAVKTINELGQACETDMALPAVVYLASTYADDLSEALARSAGAGGDSAARGIAVGAILGAALGPETLPQSWLDGLSALQRIKRFLKESR